MINLKFSGFTFELQPTSIYTEGLPIFENSVSQTVEESWNGEKYNVQNIITPTYSLIFNMRENEFKNFSLVQFAPTIYVYYEGVTMKTKGSELSFTSERVGNEFIKIKIVFANLLESKTENVIFASDEVDKFNIAVSVDAGYYFTANVYNKVLDSNSFIQNEASNFKNIINDYTKTSNLETVRLYLTDEDSANLYSHLNKVKPSGSYINIQNINQNFTQFTFAKTKIGKNLNRFDFVLIYDDPIIAMQY